MKRVFPFLLLTLGFVACNRQAGYFHSAKEFTALDKKAIVRVQQMVLGRIDILNSIAAEFTDEESPSLHPCGYKDYEVSKVIRRDLNQIQGEYPEEIHVVCRTSTDDSGLLYFEWDFDVHLERISGFKFGFDPTGFMLEDE